MSRLGKMLALGVISLYLVSVPLVVGAEAYGNIQDFRLGISCSDGSPGNQEGITGWTNYLSTGRSDTGWVSDSNLYDPDYYKLSFVQGSNILKLDQDFRIGIQMCDNKAGQNVGEIQYTPWASEGGGWSAFAGDSNNYDPDYVKVIVETRTLSGYKASNVRFALQLCDGGRDGNNSGVALYTPWVNDINTGNTGWVADSNGYDPDAIRIRLNVK